MKKYDRLSFVLFALVMVCPPAALGRPAFNEELLKFFSYRSLGPARQGGRILDIVVPESRPHTFFVASASGGLWKTVNNGTTFEPIFDRQTTIVIGDIDVAASNPDIIWVGTDDGRVHLTRNGGGTWEDLTVNLARAGAPEDYCVSRVIASSHQGSAAYIAKTGFQRDEFTPHLYKTSDFGKTWASVAGDLPKGIIYVVVEDSRNPNLLFIGKETGVFAAIDGGKRWLPLKNNMPTVPVFDLLIHPRENDLVVGSHGRGVFVTDISPLQELDEKVLAAEAHLFEVEPRIRRARRAPDSTASPGI